MRSRLDITALMRPHTVLSSDGASGWRWVVEPSRRAARYAAAQRAVGTVPPRLRRQFRSADYRRAVGGAFLAPWFAVSVGMMVAASLTLADPAATLSFPSAKAGHCRLVSCSARDLPRLGVPHLGVSHLGVSHLGVSRLGVAQASGWLRSGDPPHSATPAP
jgi:hypothetical protein